MTISATLLFCLAHMAVVFSLLFENYPLALCFGLSMIFVIADQIVSAIRELKK